MAANFSEANLENANFKNAKFYETIMPDGTIRVDLKR